MCFERLIAPAQGVVIEKGRLSGAAVRGGRLCATVQERRHDPSASRGGPDGVQPGKAAAPGRSRASARLGYTGIAAACVIGAGIADLTSRSAGNLLPHDSENNLGPPAIALY